MATQDISQLVVEVKSKGIQTAASQLDKLAVASDKAEVAVKRLGTAVVGVNGTLSGGVANAAALVAAMTTLTAVLNRMATTTTAARVATRGHNEAMAEAHALARGLSGSLGALWVTYGNLAGMGVGIALGASLKGVVGVGKDVEQTLESIRVLGGATTSEIAEMQKAISGLGKGAQGPKDVAEALSVLTLAGLNAKEAMQGVQAALNLAVAGGVTVEKSAETLVQVGSALGYTADGFDHVADVIAKAAAVSMSSVDSISNAFKSAAAVGEVYGATLQDIALGLAAVANLGIQGTSAGTALKNFYKDLSASTDKVTKTLGDMHLTIASFRDADGFMLPLYEVVKKLDSGLSGLTSSARNFAMVKLFSQQGVREGAELVKLFHTASTEMDALGNNYTNKLAEMADSINKSAAFATLAAIAMGQTTTNQLKSVANTMQTVFADAFNSVAPQIGEIARALKATFNSPEVSEGLKSLIVAVAELTKTAVVHLDVIGKIALAYGTWKVAEFIVGLGKMAVAFQVASVAAGGFALSLAPITIAIMGMASAWGIYKLAHEKAMPDNGAAAANLNEFNTNLATAAEKERKITEMRLSGISEVEIARKQQIEEDRSAAAQAIAISAKGVQAIVDEEHAQYAKLTASQKLVASQLAMGQKVDVTSSQLIRYKGILEALTRAETTHANQVKITTAITDNLIKSRTQNSALIDEAARKALVQRPHGDGNLSGKGDRAADNAAYAKSILEQEGIIKAAYNELKYYKQQQEQDLKAGKIGDLGFLENVAEKEIQTYSKVSKALAAQINIADKTKNKDGDAQRYQNELDQLVEKAGQSDVMRLAKRQTLERESAQYITDMKVKQLNDEGKYREAAELKFSSENSLTYQKAIADAMAYGDVFPHLWDVVKGFSDRQAAAMDAGGLKGATKDFEVEALKLANTLKGFKAYTVGMSLGEMMDSAAEATINYNKQLKVAQAEYAKLAKLAENGRPDDVKAAEEAKKKLLSESDKFRQMWTDTGNTIGTALEAAFGRGGKALGDMYKAKAAMDQNETQSTEAKLKGYGDMAQAASGFFDKQSKGYKALNAISQVFHVASMARTLAQTAASIVAGAAQFFAQSGWGGFAGVAAMGAVLAGLGYAVAGGSSGQGGKSAEDVQKTQGTGGVFGDAKAKSETITKSIETLKTNSDMMLPLTQSMLTSLKAIEASMVGLTNLVLRTTGVTDGTNMGITTGTISKSKGLSGGAELATLAILTGGIGLITNALVGLWGKTTKEIVDSGIKFKGTVAELQAGMGYSQYASVNTTKSSWFGLSKSTSNSVQTQGLSDELSQQFGLIFTNLEGVLKTAATTLGTTSDDVAKAINNMVIDTGVSLKGLSGKDLQDALNGVISKAMDDIAQKAFPAMGAFRQVGEGYAQTVIRVASGIEVANSELAKLGVTAIKYTDIANKTGDVTLEIVKQSIALKEGASGVGDIMKNIVGETKDLTAAYAELVAARKQMNDVGLGNGLSMDTLNGTGSLKNLTSDLSTYYDKFFTAAEKAAIETANMTQSFKDIGYTLPDSRDTLRSWIEAAAKAGDQTTVGKLLNLVGMFDKLVTSAGNATSVLGQMLSALDLAFSNLKDSVSHAKDMENREYKAANDASNDHHKAVLKAIDADTAAQIAALKATEAVRRAQANATLDGLKEQMANINVQEKALKALGTGLEKIIGSIDQAIEATKPAAQSYTRAMNKLREAMTLASTGGDIGSMSGLSDALKTVSSNSTDSYASAFEYQRAQAEANSLLNSLKASGETALSDTQKQLEALDATKQAIDDQTKALKDAISNLGNGEQELIKSNAQKLKDEEDARYQAEQDSLNSRHQAIIDALDEQLRLASDQVDALKGIDTGLKSLADALRAFGVAVSAAKAVGAGTTSTAAAGIADVKTASDKYGANAYYLNAFNGYDAKLDAAGKSASNGETPQEMIGKIFGHSDLYWRTVQQMYDAGLHPTADDTTIPGFDVGTKGERIVPASDNAELMRRLNNDEQAKSTNSSNDGLKAVVGELIAVIQIGDIANVQKANDLFKIVRDWETTGMPPTRTPTT
jgi:TP901 family phage tail tape measure protein